MPPCAIDYDEEDFLRIRAGQLGEERRHRFAVDIRQEQTMQRAIVGTHGGKGVTVLADDLRAGFGTQRLGSPATPGIADASKAGLVFEEQTHRSWPLSFHLGLGQLGQFFLKAC